MNDVVSVAERGFVTAPLMEVKDPELKEHTQAILRHANETKSHMFAIAMHLLIIKEKGLYMRDGFDGIGDYSLKVLGYKPVTTSNMINIAKNYLTPDGNGDYHSILARDNGEDYTLNQLLEVKSLGEEVVKEMDGAGEISPDMSVRAIRNAVKAKKGGEKAGEKKPRKKRDKVKEMERTAKPVTDVSLCVTRIMESIPVVLESEDYKGDAELRKVATRLLELLSEGVEDEEV